MCSRNLYKSPPQCTAPPRADEGGETLVRGRVSAKEDELERLHIVHRWIPGRGMIRPTPEAMEQKRQDLMRLDSDFHGDMTAFLVAMVFPEGLSVAEQRLIYVHVDASSGVGVGPQSDADNSNSNDNDGGDSQTLSLGGAKTRSSTSTSTSRPRPNPNPNPSGHGLEKCHNNNRRTERPSPASDLQDGTPPPPPPPPANANLSEKSGSESEADKGAVLLTETTTMASGSSTQKSSTQSSPGGGGGGGGRTKFVESAKKPNTNTTANPNANTNANANANANANPDLNVVNFDSIRRVLLPNRYPYQVPAGTRHSVLWYASAVRCCPDNVITRHIDESISRQMHRWHPHREVDFEFVWYLNPKMTFPHLFHVQCFWRIKGFRRRNKLAAATAAAGAEEEERGATL